jgi:hypothetical protein
VIALGALRTAYRILGVFGFPVECAFDTITIGRKAPGRRVAMDPSRETPSDEHAA